MCQNLKDLRNSIMKKDSINNIEISHGGSAGRSTNKNSKNKLNLPPNQDQLCFSAVGKLLAVDSCESAPVPGKQMDTPKLPS